MSSDQDKDKDNSSHVSGILRPLLNRVGSIAHHVGLVRRPDSPRLTRKPDDNEALEKAKKDIRNAVSMLMPLPELNAVLAVVFHPDEPIDDRNFVTEALLELLYTLPPESPITKMLEERFITLLWMDLGHPPMMYAGDKYRSPDGSGYSILLPWLGKARSRYAKSVQIMRPLPIDKPDPYLVFDTVMVRKKFEPNPSQISSLLFSLALLITHDLFNTRHADMNWNETSSYLDLSPLYGNSQEDQDQIRTFKLGMLKPDTFADYRPLAQLPHFTALLIMFNRHHNWIANRLYQIDDGDQFRVNPAQGVDDKTVDERLFGAARLVNCGFYINIVLHDYLRSILGINRVNTKWYLNPLVDYSTASTKGTSLARGTGNQVSIEFNNIYRWHPAISVQDEAWMNAELPKVFGPNLPNMNHVEFLKAAAKWRADVTKQPPEEREFDGIKRQKNGKFDDSQLVERLVNGIEWVAGRFGPHHIPKILRPIEVLGVIQSRIVGTCGLNEFRQFLNLKPYINFNAMVDSDANPAATQAMKVLYGNPWNVELYPGLMAEAAKPKRAGSGICLNYTTSRAILSDAVVLVRGDRYYAYADASSYTTWGLEAFKSDPDIAGGNMMSSLLLRHFPDHFKRNSAYAFYAFNTPPEVKENLTQFGLQTDFDFTRPATRPEELPPRKEVTTYEAAEVILSDPVKFRPSYADKIQKITSYDDFRLVWDPIKLEMREGSLHHAFALLHHLLDSSLTKELYTWTVSTANRLIKERQQQLPEEAFYKLDVAREVCNSLPIHFVAEYFGIPLKTESHPDGTYTEPQLHAAFLVLGTYLLSDAEPNLSYALNVRCRIVFQEMHEQMKKILSKIKGKGVVGKVFEGVLPVLAPLRHDGQIIMQRLMAGHDSDEAAAIVIIISAMIVCTVGEVATKAIYHILSPSMAINFEKDLSPLLKQDTAEAREKLRDSILELNRVDPYLRDMERIVTQDIEGLDGTKWTSGTLVNVRMREVYRDPEAFPDPNNVDPTRPHEKYLTFGSIATDFLTKTLFATLVTGTVRAVLDHSNIKLNPAFRSTIRPVDAEGIYVFVTRLGDLVAFPPNLDVTYDL